MSDAVGHEVAADDVAAAAGPLHDAQRLLRLFEGSAVGMSLTDLDGSLVACNTALIRMLDRAPETVIGSNFRDFTHPDDVALDSALFDELLSGSRSHYEIEKRYLNRSNAPVWVRLTVSSLPGRDGRPALALALVEDISGRRQAEEALALWRAQLDLIVDVIDDGVLVQRQDGAIVYANLRAAERMGFASVAEVLSRTREELVRRFHMVSEDGTDFPHEMLPIDRVLAGEESAEALVGFRIGDSDVTQWSLVRSRRAPIGASRDEYVVTVLVDVTERTRTEQERRLRLEHEVDEQRRFAFLADAGEILAGSLDYQTTLDALAHLAISYMADWCVIDVIGESGAHERVSVAHREREMERWAREVARRFPKEEQSAFTRMVETRESRLVPVVTPEMLEVSSQSEEYREILRHLGMRSVMSVVLEARGHVLGAMTLISTRPDRQYSSQDFTLATDLARRAAIAIDNARLYQEATQVSAEKDAILRQMADGVCIADPEGRIVYVNEAAARIAGASDPGRTHEEYIESYGVVDMAGKALKPEDLPLPRAIAGEIVTDYVWQSRRPDGSLVVLQASASQVRDSTGRLLGAVMTFRDATAQYELDRQKDTFLSLIGHELRTPLTVLHGYVQLLQRRGVDEAVQSPLAVMARQAEHLVGLVNTLLDLSRIETGQLDYHMVELDYREMVGAVIEEMGTLYPDRVLRVRAPQAIAIEADAARLRQVITNLIDNALKYGPRDGKITITIEPDSGRVVTYVCDEGPPIPPAHREKMFNRFYRVERGRESGLGIGLFVTRAIVEAHGGEVWVADHEHASVAFSLARTHL